MQSNIIKTSLSFLPIDDIAAELRSEKPGRKFLTKDENADDVNNVAGVPSNMIAKSISSENRTTVDNALHLNGKASSDYLLKEDGQKISGATTVMSEIYSNEILNLKDSLLTAQSELIKNGFLNDYIPYGGFVDSFKKNNVKYEGYLCGISKAIVGNAEDLFINDISKAKYFEANKKFIIKRTDLDKEIVVTSKGITESGKVTFTPTTNMLDSIEAVQLLKTSGEYLNDSFSYSEVKRNVSNAQKERYYMQADDTRTAFQNITKSNTGYAVYTKVPNYAAGALTKFTVRAKAVGTPGSLLCHVLKKEAVVNSHGAFNCKFKNIEDAKRKGFLVASSQQVPSSDATTETDLTFDFFNVITNRYPVLQGDQYLFVIECLGATNDDYWQIRFSYYQNYNDEIEDLEKYNTSYFYQKLFTESIDDNEVPLKIINEIDKYDMIFTLVTREMIDEDEMGKQEGIYTSDIIFPEPINASKMRLTLRINREGCYYMTSYDNTYKIFTIEKNTSTSHTVNDTRFKEGDTVIIGNKIAKIKRLTGNQIETVEPVYIDSRINKFYTETVYNSETDSYVNETKIPVYRMNYVPYIKPSYIDWQTWDDSKKKFKTTDLVENPMKLDLKAVIPDGKKSNKRVSDKLIFECSLEKNSSGIAKIANELELQIHWRSPFSYEEINDFKDLNDNNFKELIGRMHTISLACLRIY